MKLNADQKRELKELKEWFKGFEPSFRPRFYQDEFVAVYMVDEFPGSRTSLAGWSMVSPHDTFKKKTGKYHALIRLYDCTAVFPRNVEPHHIAELISDNMQYPVNNSDVMDYA